MSFCLKKSYHTDFIDVNRRSLHGLASLLRVPLTNHHRALHLVLVLEIELRTVDSPLAGNLTEERIRSVRQLEHHRIDNLLLARLLVGVLTCNQSRLIQNSYCCFHSFKQLIEFFQPYPCFLFLIILQFFNSSIFHFLSIKSR